MRSWWTGTVEMVIAEERGAEEEVDYSNLIRDVTDDEVDSFDHNGWVFMPGFVAPDLIAKVLERFMCWSGIDTLELPDDPAKHEAFRASLDKAAGRARSMFAARLDDPWIFNYLAQRKFGEAAARMLKVPSIKVLGESLLIKAPESSGRGFTIPWHQDFPNLPVDRAQVMQMWTALVPISAEMGTMSHLSGSHREPPGGMFGFGSEDARETYPEVFARYQESEPRAYQPGDAMFHHSLAWHRSGSNTTNRVRWAITNLRMTANALYTGQNSTNTDGMGLTFRKTFDHPDFPTVYP